MKKYKYTAVTINKERVTGTFIAADEHDLALQLVKQNLYLVSCSPYSGLALSSFFTLSTGKITMPELTTFCRQYAIMINAGISLLACLDILKSQEYSSFFKRILGTIYDDIKGGMMLSEAVNKHGKVFPEFFRNMLRVGEVSGKLEMVFNSLADYYETDSMIKKKVKAALAYPIVLMCMMVGIVVLMLTVIVPTFRDSLSSLDVEAEGITKVVYDLSDFILANWMTIFMIILAVIGIGVVFGLTKKGKYFYDSLVLKLPLVNKVQINLVTSRFARSFSLLLMSGMDLVEALEAAAIIIGNRNVEERFRKATDDVRQGMSLAAAFEKHKLFPTMMIQMVSVGEKTASLDDVLSRSSSFFDEQVQTTLTSLASKIQPIMLVIMGAVVGTLFIAVYSPMISIMENIGR